MGGGVYVNLGKTRAERLRNAAMVEAETPHGQS